MSDMPPTYDFKNVEQRLYQWWEENGWFKPECRPADAQPFVISIPPPNVTGELHQGHALFAALEDLMIRRARMQGFAALWVPGTDHAGIATQLQVEKHLLRTEEVTREEMGREAFVERVWEWKREKGSYITNQLRRLGASCDWDRERFTLDDGLSRAVREAFVRLHRMGLIYQSEYLVNWSPGLQTAVSDLEVEYSEEPGFLYYFKYPLKDGGYLPVATTRPETILGDTAVAVHPDDERYQQYIGQTALVPMLNREIPVIADSYVEMAFGTGALKVTPGHDVNDFDIGQRHNLPIVNAMNKDATMSDACGPYAGMDRFDCRKQLWADMQAADLTLKVDNHTLNVPRSQRGGEIVEPLVSKQWFVNVKPMADLALAAVHSGRIRIVPERFVKIWDNWLENIRPWCISRQLWWGHRIPVWNCAVCGWQTVSLDDPDACEKCDSAQITQDPDVLDTWFSSALWPFSTLGWPDDTPDLRRFYPTDVMETGYDILFFWVARMVMAGTLFTNDVPFHTIYLHGLVRDEHGRKMSKTAGNVVDPLELMNEMGTDALRFTLLTGGSPGADMNLALAKVESNRNFGNKIWNAARFFVRNLDRASKSDAPPVGEPLPHTAADRWILTRLNELIANANRLFDSYLFGGAGSQMYDFFWSDFADWYVEIAKVQLAQGGARAWTTLHTLFHVLDQSLRLLHPYIPYVTEETWQQIKLALQMADLGIAPGPCPLSLPKGDRLPQAHPSGNEGWAEALIIADWPEAGEIDAQAAAEFELIRELARQIRAARAEYSVEPAKWIAASLAGGGRTAFLQSQRPILSALARLDESQFIIAESVAAPDNAVTLALGEVTAYLPLAGMLNLSQEKERLQKELAEAEAQIKRLSGLLNGPFAQKAPPQIVAKEQEKLADYEAEAAQLRERLASL
jgi:valyl-tRNA synthetase